MNTIVPGEDITSGISNQGDNIQDAGALADDRPLIHEITSSYEVKELGEIRNALIVKLKGNLDPDKVTEIMTPVVTWLVNKTPATEPSTTEVAVNPDKSPKANLIFDFTDETFTAKAASTNLYGFKEILIGACKYYTVVHRITFAVNVFSGEDSALVSRMIREVQAELLEDDIFADQFATAEMAVDHVKRMATFGM